MMRKTLPTLAAVLSLAVPSLSMAAFVSGPVTYTFSGIYSGTSQELTYDADNTPYSDQSVMLICIDHATDPPFTNAVDPVPIAQFDTEAGASAITGGSGAAGEAAIYWLLDQYYLSYYKNGSIEQRRALQYALWEIGNDYKGTAASIDIASGSSKPSAEDVTQYGGTDQAAFVSAYNTLYDAMRANLPTLRTTYRSNTYTMDLFRNRDSRYQHMVALIEKAPPNTVPIAVPSITGTPQVGSSVTGQYTYADNNADVEDPSGTTYKFVTSPNSSIANSSAGTTVASGVTGGASSSVPYTLQPADLNQYLYYCVTPAAITGASPGLEACTVASGPVAAEPVNVVPTAIPTISGVPKVGSVVSGNYSYADTEGDIEAPAQTSYKFVTSTSSTISGSGDGTVVASGSTGGVGHPATYTLQPSDLNKYVYFCVTPAAQTGATPGLEVCTLAVGPVANTIPSSQAPTPVPTLSAWALACLAAMLGFLGVRRRV